MSTVWIFRKDDHWCKKLKAFVEMFSQENEEIKSVPDFEQFAFLLVET